MVLEQKDESNWIYRGEGAVNLVLDYKHVSETEDVHSTLTSDKCRQWEETQDAQHAITPI